MEQRTEEWFEARLGKVTASKVGDVMMKPTTAGYQNYKAQLICERLTGRATEAFQSSAMQHGTETEPQARAIYIMRTGLDVQEVGFVPHPAIDMSGASPDGLVGDNGLVEIKCPQPAKHIKTLTGGGIDKAYRLQMQWQMACTGREWCDFVSFSPEFPPEMQMSITRVNADAELIREMEDAVRAFSAEVSKTLKELKASCKREAA